MAAESSPTSSIGRHGNGLSFGRSSQGKNSRINPLKFGQAILALEIVFECGKNSSTESSHVTTYLSDSRKALKRSCALGIWSSKIRELYRMEIFHIARGDTGDTRGVFRNKSSLARAGAHSLVSQRDLDSVISGADRKAVLDVRQGCILFSICGHRAIITQNRALIFLEEGADESLIHFKDLVATQIVRWNTHLLEILKRENAYENAYHLQPISNSRSPHGKSDLPMHLSDELTKAMDLYFQAIVISSEPSFEFLILTTLIKAVEERLSKNLLTLDQQVQVVLQQKGATDVETQALQDVQEQVTAFYSSLESATGEIVDVLEDEEDLQGLCLSQIKILHVDPIELSREVNIAADAAGVLIQDSKSREEKEIKEVKENATSTINANASVHFFDTQTTSLHHERTSLAIGDIAMINDHLHALEKAVEHTSILARHFTEIGASSGGIVSIPNPLFSHDLVIAEELLEWIKGNIDAFSSKSRMLSSQLEGAHKKMTLRLASNRNELMLLQLDLQTITMALGVCSMVSGFLGMNLGNGACGPDGCDDAVTNNHGYSYFLLVVFLSVSLAILVASIMFTLSRTKSGNAAGFLERCRRCWRRGREDTG
jgi:hypothetical protein